ncbi:MAG: TonB-dependent receptor plug domain-containing protein [Sphingomonadaceae bacterium]|nr:TonB-dependent receptor plug domain-containing protein [Sphingomonadaceae bacterium]
MIALASAPALAAEAEAEAKTEAAAVGEQGAAPVVGEGAQVYRADFFARFGPRTALDMLTQIPGFVLRDDGGQRGLGQATANVLVNGQRLTGKSEGTFSQLGRIAASNVERIELVEAAKLDVPGLAGQVANVIVRDDGISGNFAYRFEARAKFTKPLHNRFEASLSGKLGEVGYTLGLSNLSHRGGAGGEGLIRAADGTLLERRDDVILSYFDAPKVSLGLKYTGANGIAANFNGSYTQEYFRLTIDDVRLPVGGVARNRAIRERENERNYELGGDLTLPLGPGSLKLIGLARGEHEPFSSQSIFTYADGSVPTGDRFELDSDSSERIARAEYGWRMGGADWQLSAEAAFNKLENAARLFTLAPGGDFTPVPFPQGTGAVKEDRYETVLSYSRKLTGNLALQLTAGGEFSRLTQSGAASLRREFWRPKGSLSLAWTADEGLDISVKARRRVGQLEFGDFMARVFFENGNSNAGNAELVPPQSWELELEAKRSLGKWGNTTLRLYDYRISDLVDIIPVGASGESPGNLDGGRRYGLEWASTIELAPLGIKGAKADLKLFLEGSRVTDPLTGLSRPISRTRDRGLEISYRHDIPGSMLAYGVIANYNHFTDYVRLGEVGRSYEGPTFMGVFVEHKDVLGLTVRASVNNLLGGRNEFARTVWTGRRNNSPIAFTETRSREIGPIFSVLVRGNV